MGSRSFAFSILRRVFRFFATFYWTSLGEMASQPASAHLAVSPQVSWVSTSTGQALAFLLGRYLFRPTVKVSALEAG